jgi:alpha-ketoglutarate-dependent taurine dioxygenase
MQLSTFDGQSLPLVIEREHNDPAVVDLIKNHHADLRKKLTEHGALLLRGFDVGGVDGFHRVVQAISGEPLTYQERSSPRHSIKGNVYTSTDYPPTHEIFLHNENSYQASWPLVLFFYCIEEPETQGATPLADVRQVYQMIDESVRAEFEARRWMAVRNFHPDFGVPWQQVFNTDDRDEVERYCRSRGIELEWRGENSLRTRAVRDAVHRHPVTGELVWFNHITFFNVTTLAPDIREGLLDMFDYEDLPTHTYYGDGGAIPDDVMDHLRDCYRRAYTRFDWRKDDVLIVDNMLAAHGREPFTGPRKIAVAMAEPVSVA